VAIATQQRHPWRATLRTVVAAAVAALPLVPEVVGGLHIGTTATVTQFLAISAGVTRLLARPDVEAWLHVYAPWLTAQPAASVLAPPIPPIPPTEPVPAPPEPPPAEPLEP